MHRYSMIKPKQSAHLPLHINIPLMNSSVLCSSSFVNLTHTLHTYYTDESFSLDLPTDTSDAKKLMLASAWQSEFLPVSNALLARIQTYSNKNSSQLEQLTEDDYQTSET